MLGNLGLFPCPTDTSFPQTVPVTLLEPRACSRLHATLESDGIPILPGMVCTSVVGEPPHCEAKQAAVERWLWDTANSEAIPASLLLPLCHSPTHTLFQALEQPTSPAGSGKAPAPTPHPEGQGDSACGCFLIPSSAAQQGHPQLSLFFPSDRITPALYFGNFFFWRGAIFL